MPLNQRVSAPYGDITIFSSPKTDRFIAQRQQEQRQEELQRQREIDEADKQLSSHLGNVLNPDIPDIVSGWQEYKNAKKQLLFDPKLQKDPNAYAQKQMEVNTLLANTLQTIGASKQRKDTLYKQLDMSRTAPHKMEDNAAQRIMMGMSTPTKFAMQNPDFDNHTWGGVDMNFTKGVNEAAGKPRVIKTTYAPIGTTGEKRIPTDVYGSNTPEEFLSSLNNQAGDRKYSMNASKAFLNTDPALVEDVNRRYANMTKDRYENWGYKELPNLDPSNPNDPVQQFNSLQAKTYALNHRFETKDRKAETDPEVKRKLDEASKARLQRSGILQRLAASKDLAAYKKSIGVGSGSGDEGGDVLEPVLQHWEQEAKQGGSFKYKTADGQDMNVNMIKAPQALKQALAVRDGAKLVAPDAVAVADNGDYMGVFYKKEPAKLPDGKDNPKAFQPVVGENGMYSIDKSMPVNRVSRDDAKIEYGKQVLSKKENQKIMEGVVKPKGKKELTADEILKKYGIQ